jgi:hypothetical protein
MINGDLKLSVPKLMILGILYSASSARTRSERFYELIQLDLEPSIYQSDEEFKDMFPLMGQICYNFIIKHFNQSIDFLNKNNERFAKLYPQLKEHVWKPISTEVFDPRE